MKLLDEHFAELYLKYNAVISNSSKEIIKHNDNMIVWPVSLSTGAIVLIISNLDKLQFLSTINIYICIVLFAIAIISGLLTRFINTHTLRLSSSLIDDFYFRSLLETLPHHPFTLKGDETSEEIHMLLIESFNITESNILQVSDEDARNYYKMQVEFRISEYDRVKTKFDRLMIDTLGLPHNYFEAARQKNEEGGYRKRRYTKKTVEILSGVSNILYFVTVISFVAAIIYLVSNIKV